MDNGLIVRGATVLTMDPSLGDLEHCDIHVQDGRIRAVGPHLDAGTAQVIDAQGMLAIPGLIDTHTHMWQGPIKGLGAGMWGMADYTRHIFSLRDRFSPADMGDANFATGVEMLDNGITTALDFCHNLMSPHHAEPALAGHARTGQRVLFCYGMLGRTGTLKEDHAWKLEQVRAFARAHEGPSDRLVRFGLGVGSLEFTGMDLFRKEVELGRELGLPMTFHQNVAGQVHEIEAAALWGPDLLPVHCNPILDREIDILARHGCGISFTPESEVGDGRDTSVIARADVAGVTPSLGVDVPCRVALDLFSQMRITFLLMRAEEAAQERVRGRWPLARYPGTPRIQPRHLLHYATVNAARAVGLGSELGSIAPGKIADIVLLRNGAYSPSLGDPASHVVLQSSIADVDTVIVQGQVRKRAGALLHVEREEVVRATAAVRARLFGTPSH